MTLKRIDYLVFAHTHPQFDKHVRSSGRINLIRGNKYIELQRDPLDGVVRVYRRCFSLEDVRGMDRGCVVELLPEWWRKCRFAVEAREIEEYCKVRFECVFWIDEQVNQ